MDPPPAVARVPDEEIATRRQPTATDLVKENANVGFPFLAGRVTRRSAERSWDCPCHASRFAPDGSVLQGPGGEPAGPP